MQTNPQHVRIVHPTARRLGGLFMAIVSLFGTWTSWSQVMEHGTFKLALSMMPPAFFAIGVGLLLFPGYREERLARGEDIGQLEGYALITPRWWGVLVLALLLGGAWVLFLAYGPVDALPLPTWHSLGWT
jgi:hypothetical protein